MLVVELQQESVPHTVTALLAVTALSVPHMEIAPLVEIVLPMVTAMNVLRITVVSAQSAPLMVIVLLVVTAHRMVTVTSVLPTTVASVLSVRPSTVAETVLHMVTVPSVLALTVMHLVASVPPTATAHLVVIVLLTVTAMNVMRTIVVSVQNAQHSTAENAPSVLPMVTVTTAPPTTVASVLSAQLSVIVLLVETALRMVTATIVPHATSVETVPVTTRTKHLVVPHQTSTLQRTRRHASLLKRTSYSSVSKHRQPQLLMSMV
jgi:hypothetical protein